MENTITALKNGITGGSLFFDPLEEFIPIVLLLIPIAVGWRLLTGTFTGLQRARIQKKWEKWSKDGKDSDDFFYTLSEKEKRIVSEY